MQIFLSVNKEESTSRDLTIDHEQVSPQSGNLDELISRTSL